MTIEQERIRQHLVENAHGIANAINIEDIARAPGISPHERNNQADAVRRNGNYIP
jgi:hypothetical protein